MPTVSTRPSIAARLLGAALAALVLASCAPAGSNPDAGTVEARGDATAARVLEACGGDEAWRALPYLEFQFAIERNGVRTPVARHLWDRTSGDYRMVWTQNDTAVVALFNVRSRAGRVFLNDSEADSSSTPGFLASAYRRFINDTYWLLMPVKLLDPGVRRAFEADSSDAETDVVRLTFGDVGLTPGDTYWVYVDRTTGRVRRWAYVLQGNPDAPPTYFEWTDWKPYPSEKGDVWMSSRKPGAGIAILTDSIRTPASVPSELFLQP